MGTIGLAGGATAGTVRLVAVGEFDLVDHDALREALARARRSGCGQVDVDTSAVTFMDAGTVGILVRANLEARVEGVDLVVTDPSEAVRHVLAVLGALELLLPRRKSPG